MRGSLCLEEVLREHSPDRRLGSSRRVCLGLGFHPDYNGSVTRG